MLVKIVKALTKRLWYANSIGETYHVKPLKTRKGSLIKGIDWWHIDGTDLLIRKCDCEEVR